MRRLAVLAAAAMLAAAAVSADAAAPGFRYGVAAGEITATSAILWTRAPGSGAVTVRVSRNRSLAASRLATAKATASDDLTLSIAVRGLSPGSRYYYEFAQGRSRSRRGTFVTAPGSATSANVRFAISGDADATPGKDGTPGFNTFQVYAAMANEANDFNINLGDTIYSDSELAGRAGRAHRDARSGRSTGSASRCQRWSGSGARPVSTATGTTTSSSTISLAPRTASAIYAAGVKAFTDYAPVAKPSTNGPLPHVPLGQEPRALLPRRALVPQRQGNGRLRRRPRADGAASGARRFLDASRPGCARPSRRRVSPR